MDPKSPGDAVDLLRRCLQEGDIIETRHFKQRLLERGLSVLQARHVINRGSIYKPPELDSKTREWKYTVEGHEPDGLWLGVVFCFTAADAGLLITIFGVEERSKK